MAVSRSCRKCACTDVKSYAPRCWWVSKSLCSTCATPSAKTVPLCISGGTGPHSIWLDFPRWKVRKFKKKKDMCKIIGVDVKGYWWVRR